MSWELREHCLCTEVNCPRFSWIKEKFDTLTASAEHCLGSVRVGHSSLSCAVTAENWTLDVCLALVSTQLTVHPGCEWWSRSPVSPVRSVCSVVFCPLPLTGGPAALPALRPNDLSGVRPHWNLPASVLPRFSLSKSERLLCLLCQATVIFPFNPCQPQPGVCLQSKSDDEVMSAKLKNSKLPNWGKKQCRAETPAKIIQLLN